MHRYIQTVLTHDLVQELNQEFDAMAEKESQIQAEERDERARQLRSRFAGISLTVDG
jgi:hypothetical protein